tara:strand:- start:237 stop:845 length:609 start_codon:yes stop_codon:yes gene_type:complete
MNLVESNSPLDIYSNLLMSWEGIPPTNDFISRDYISNYLNKNMLIVNNCLIESMMLNDLKTYLTDDILQKVDRASMSVSLETRCPFLDHNLIEFALKIPTEMKVRGGISKFILRKMLSKYLPYNLYERPKMGFSIPIDNWLKTSLRDWAEDLLSESSLESHGLLNTKMIRSAWKNHLNNYKNMQLPLWNVLMFQSWAAKYKI